MKTQNLSYEGLEEFFILLPLLRARLLIKTFSINDNKKESQIDNLREFEKKVISNLDESCKMMYLLGEMGAFTEIYEQYVGLYLALGESTKNKPKEHNTYLRKAELHCRQVIRFYNKHKNRFDRIWEKYVQGYYCLKRSIISFEMKKFSQSKFFMEKYDNLQEKSFLVKQRFENEAIIFKQKLRTMRMDF